MLTVDGDGAAYEFSWEVTLVDEVDVDVLVDVVDGVELWGTPATVFDTVAVGIVDEVLSPVSEQSRPHEKGLRRGGLTSSIVLRIPLLQHLHRLLLPR